MVDIRKILRGSYTVEGTVIVSFICIIVGIVVMMGFFVHDYAVMQSTADELAVMGSLWSGRYVSPEYKEVDYEALKQKQVTDLKTIEAKGYALLDERLLCGNVQSIAVSKQLFGHCIQVEICTDFELGHYSFDYTVLGESNVFDSRDLPRRRLEDRQTNE